MIQLKESPNPVPFDLIMYKGAKSYRLPRIFVQFLLEHPVAAKFLEWSKHMLVLGLYILYDLIMLIYRFLMSLLFKHWPEFQRFPGMMEYGGLNKNIHPYLGITCSIGTDSILVTGIGGMVFASLG